MKGERCLQESVGCWTRHDWTEDGPCEFGVRQARISHKTLRSQPEETGQPAAWICLLLHIYFAPRSILYRPLNQVQFLTVQFQCHVHPFFTPPSHSRFILCVRPRPAPSWYIGVVHTPYRVGHVNPSLLHVVSRFQRVQRGNWYAPKTATVRLPSAFINSDSSDIYVIQAGTSSMSQRVKHPLAWPHILRTSYMSLPSPLSHIDPTEAPLSTTMQKLKRGFVRVAHRPAIEVHDAITPYLGILPYAFWLFAFKATTHCELAMHTYPLQRTLIFCRPRVITIKKR